MWVPPAAAVVLWRYGSRLGRTLPPATAVPLLSAAAVVTALSSGFVLAVAAFVVLGQVPAVAAVGRWSAAALRAGDQVPVGAGLLAAGVVAALLVSLARRVFWLGRDLLVSASACRRLGPGAHGLVVIDHDQPEAFSVPGMRGRIVVSTAMLRALDPEERRVLLAHETAHLAHHHHFFVQLSELAAAANPLLHPVARAVRVAVERWADEVAATQVGDRRLAARALARAGLARAAATAVDGGVPATALAAVDGHVAERAQALLDEPPRRRLALAAAVAALAVTAMGAAVQTGHEAENRFEQAQAVYSSQR